MTGLAVAAVSARLMAEAAAGDGFDVVALDVFGDADTRSASREWLPIGTPGCLQIDGAALLEALQSLARHGDIAGWVAGSGFEALPDLLQAGTELLPLVGTAPDGVRRAHDPLDFFSFLAAQGIPHPPVRQVPPADPTGWLAKDARGTGGWHVRRAAAGAATPTTYFQREVPGQPMSATFVAGAQQARLLGFNRQIVCRFGDRPFVFCGVVGPVPLEATAARQIERAIGLLAAELSLQGLASLDFMLDEEDCVQVLELNPRPPASLALYRARVPGGVMAAHWRACTLGELPGAVETSGNIEGTTIVYARRGLALDGRGARCLADWPLCHDRPLAGARFETGDPICSLSAAGASAEQVTAQLEADRQRLLETLENHR